MSTEGMTAAAPSGRQYPGRFTKYVMLICIIAASRGLIFGYGSGISGGVMGGVMSMGKLVQNFFPKVDGYPVLHLFTSSLYLAGLVATVVGAGTTHILGPRPSLVLAGVSLLIGGILSVAAQGLAMLTIGRILLGLGMGFANQALPLYLSTSNKHLRLS